MEGEEEEEGGGTCIWCPVADMVELSPRDFAFCCRSFTSCFAYTAHVWRWGEKVCSDSGSGL